MNQAFVILFLVGTMGLPAGGYAQGPQGENTFKSQSELLRKKLVSLDGERRYREMVPHYLQLRELARQYDERETFQKAQNNLALMYHRLGEMDSAVYWLEQATNYQKILPDEFHMLGIKTLRIWEALLMQSRKYAEAIPFSRKLIAEARDSMLIAIAYGNLGTCKMNLGDYQAKINLSDSALRFLPKRMGNRTLSTKAHFWFMKGKAFRKIGDLPSQLDHLREAERLYLKMSSQAIASGNLADVYNDFGLAYGEMGNFQEQLRYLRKSLAMKRRISTPDVDETPTPLYNLGIAFGQMSNSAKMGFIPSDSCKYYLQEAVRRWESQPHLNMTLLAKAYGNLSVIAGREGASALQKTYADTACVLLRNRFGEHHQDVARAWERIAQYHLAADNPELTLQALQHAIHANMQPGMQTDTYGNPKLGQAIDQLRMMIILKAKADLLGGHWSGNARMRLVAAYQTSRMGIEIADQIRRGSSPLARTGARHELGQRYDFMEVAAASYVQGLALAHQLYVQTGRQYYLEGAFEISEMSKATFLAGTLPEARIRKLAGIPDSLLGREARLTKAVYQQESHLRKKTLACESARKNKSDTELERAHLAKLVRDSTQLRLATDSLREVHRGISALIDREYPNYRQLKNTGRVPTLSEARSALLADPDAAILEYFYGDSSIFVLAIGQEAETFLRIPRTPEIDAALDSVSFFVRAGGGETTYAHHAHLLAKELVQKPLRDLDLADHSRIIIVPDGKLTQLPFAALTQTADCHLGGTCEFLVSKYDFSYNYSLQHLLTPKLKRPKHTARSRYFGYLNLFRKKENGVLEQFQHSMQAGKQIFGGQTMTTNQTQKASLMAALEQQALPEILYFLTHGFNAQNPWDSYLLLAPDSLDKAAVDKLFVHELFTTKLHTELLILPACFSADNIDLASYGPISISRACQLAGARSMVTSLWEADASRSNRILEQFLKNLGEGMSRTRALSTAKQSYLSRLQNAHPKYWANLILTGNSGEILSPPQKWLPLGIFFMFLSVSISCLYINRLGSGAIPPQ